MTAKRVAFREIARRDIRQVRDFYLLEAGEPTAARFLDAIQAAFIRIAEYPGSGSARHALTLRIPDLRSCTLGGFPYLVFYVERAGRIEIWRVLHAQRDVPKGLREEA